MTAQTTPSPVLVIKFGGGSPAGMMQADGAADDAFGGPGHEGGWWVTAGMLQGDGGKDNAFNDPRHEVFLRDPCGDASGQWWRGRRIFCP